MNYLSPSRLLRTTLAIDAAASGTLALIQLLAPYAVAQLTGLAVELLVATGVLLAAYAALLIRMASSAAVARTLVELVAVGNLGWALTCIVLATALAQRPIHTRRRLPLVPGRCRCRLCQRAGARTHAIDPGVASNRESRLERPALTEAP